LVSRLARSDWYQNRVNSFTYKRSLANLKTFVRVTVSRSLRASRVLRVYNKRRARRRKKTRKYHALKTVHSAARTANSDNYNIHQFRDRLRVFSHPQKRVLRRRRRISLRRVGDIKKSYDVRLRENIHTQTAYRLLHLRSYRLGNRDFEERVGAATQLSAVRRVDESIISYLAQGRRLRRGGASARRRRSRKEFSRTRRAKRRHTLKRRRLWRDRAPRTRKLRRRLRVLEGSLIQHYLSPTRLRQKRSRLIYLS
jgi:hypothetical protein